MEGEATADKEKPQDGPPSHAPSDEGIKQRNSSNNSDVASPLSPHGQVVSDSGNAEKFEVSPGRDSQTVLENAPTQEQSDNANCTIVPVQQTKTHVFRQEVTLMEETVISVLSKITSPPILRAATNDDILVGMIRDISGKVALLHEAIKRIEAEKGQVQVTTALEALTEQQRATKEQANKANDLLEELNAKRTEMENLKMRLQQQEQDISKKVERIKELEQGQSIKVTELNTKVEGLENKIEWMDTKIKFHERDEEKIGKELSDKKTEVEKLEERHAKVTEMWKEKSQKICDAVKLQDKDIAQMHTEMGEITEKEIEIEKLKKRIAVWHNNIQSLLESSNKIETIEADGLIGLQAAERWKDSALSDLRAQLSEKEILIKNKESEIQQLTTERNSLRSECQAYKFATQTAGNYASATTDIASAHNKMVDIFTKTTRKQPAIDTQKSGNNRNENFTLALVPAASSLHAPANTESSNSSD